jgi:hypothetical protein
MVFIKKLLIYVFGVDIVSEVMEEAKVSWVLLKNQEYFAKILGLQIKRCLGTEVTTRFGRPDFIFDLSGSELLLIELETSIDSTSKFEHCTNQVKRYIKLGPKFHGKHIKVALVYGEERTSDKHHKMLSEFADRYGIILRRYSLQKILQIYNDMVNQLYRTSGISFSRAVALGVTSLSWLNKFMVPFFTCKDNEPINSRTWEELKDHFTSKTNFYVLKRLTEDFELIKITNSKKAKIIELTDAGCRFRDELSAEIRFQNKEFSETTSFEITMSQKRILLGILVNGNFTKLKVNIFHFLRFIHLTEGTWLPKPTTKLTTAERQYLNNAFKASYNARTLKDLVLQTYTFCMELGLVEKLPEPNQLYTQSIVR